MYYGAIIGDIVGSVFEFTEPRIKNKNFELFKEGCRFTDDTVMTIAIADVMNRNDFNNESSFKAKIIQSMANWGITFYNAGYGTLFSKWLQSKVKVPYNSYGNGSAMRVSPIAWCCSDIDIARKFAKWQAEVTHNNPEGIRGAEAVTSAIYLAKTKHSKKEIKDYIEDVFYYDLSRHCQEIRPSYTFNATCQGSIPESIISFLDGDDFEDSIRNAVSLGGDTDTMACIAGAIAEAYYEIPEDMIKKARKLLDYRILKVIDETKY